MPPLTGPLGLGEVQAAGAVTALGDTLGWSITHLAFASFILSKKLDWLQKLLFFSHNLTLLMQDL